MIYNIVNFISTLPQTFPITVAEWATTNAYPASWHIPAWSWKTMWKTVEETALDMELLQS